jgi:hypothetical protein
MSKLPTAKPKQVVKKPPTAKPKAGVKKPPTAKPKAGVKKPTAAKPKSVAKKLTTAKPKQVVKKPTAVKQVGRGIEQTNPLIENVLKQIPPVLLEKPKIKTSSLKPLPPVLPYLQPTDLTPLTKSTYLKPSGSVCSQVLTPKQPISICWFMATIVSMFYSQRSRKILLEASKKWRSLDKQKEDLFNLFKHVLNDRYKKPESIEDYNKFSDNTFIDILVELNKYNNKLFPYDTTIHSGFNIKNYIGKLYELLEVDYKVFYYNKITGVLFYSHLNMEINNMEYITIEKKQYYYYPSNVFKYNDASMNPPEILIVIVSIEKDTTQIYESSYPNTIISDDDPTKKEITSMDEIIEYRGSKYHLDSVILQNWNDSDETGHAIVGITCNENKYVYNGWKKRGGNDACDLMPHNWEIKGDAEKGDVCINNTNCTMDTNLQYDKRFCFNFKKGKRVLIYVRNDDNPSNTSKKQSQKP